MDTVNERVVTEQEKDEMVRHVLILMKLLRWWNPEDGESKGKRWSRSVLRQTVGWPHKDRTEVWIRVMCSDPLCSAYKNTPQVGPSQFNELHERIEKYGDDGGIE